MCELCNIVNAADFNPFTEEELDGFISDIWKGVNTTSQLDRLMYFKTADKLSEGLRLGLAISDSGAPEQGVKYRLAKDLQTNIYRFSAAKTYQQTLQMNRLLVGENGETRTFGQFQKEARKVLDTFNGNHLAAEYQRSVAGSQNALLWGKIQETKEFLPYLQYQTAGDQRVRPTHQALDNIIRKVDDPFWDSYMPPNGWRCRCTVIQLEEAEETDMTGFVKPNDVPDEFLMNTGKQRLIFNDKHPYYEVHPRDIGLASNNFNLPIPQTPTPALVGPSKKKIKEPIDSGTNFAVAKTTKEISKMIDKVFVDAYGVPVKVMTTGTKLTLNQLKAAGEQLKKLTSEYNLAEVSLSSENPTRIRFKSTSRLYGQVKPTSAGHVYEANFGDNFDARRDIEVFNRGRVDLYPKSIVDKKNIEISTITHEFAHFITTTSQRIYANSAKIEAFWSEIGTLKKQYETEIFGLKMKLKVNTSSLSELKEVYLGDYARTNFDEFFAEGFTQYKLSSSPSKYAKLIGEIVDKHFKK